MKVKAYDSVKNQVGYCGIWCGSCMVGNGALKEVTKRYKDTLRLHGLEEWAPKTFNYKEFAKGLAAILAIPPCRGCLRGGGRSDCEIRTSAKAKGIDFCGDCDTPGRCKHKKIQNSMRKGARQAGLFVMDPGNRHREKLRAWSGRLKGKWPHCVLFSH